MQIFRVRKKRGLFLSFANEEYTNITENTPTIEAANIPFVGRSLKPLKIPSSQREPRIPFSVFCLEKRGDGPTHCLRDA